MKSARQRNAAAGAVQLRRYCTRLLFTVWTRYAAALARAGVNFLPCTVAWTFIEQRKRKRRRRRRASGWLRAPQGTGRRKEGLSDGVGSRQQRRTSVSSSLGGDICSSSSSGGGGGGACCVVDHRATPASFSSCCIRSACHEKAAVEKL